MATTQNYKLSTNDMGLWPGVITLQNIFGAARPPVDDGGASYLIGWINAMTLNGAYVGISNPQLKSWMDDFFANLTNFQTNYDNKKLPEVYLGYMFQWFVRHGGCIDCLDSPDQFYTAFAKGAASDPELRWDDCKQDTVGPWGRPSKPDSWSAAINNTFTAWGTGGVPGVLSAGESLFKTSNWTNVQSLKPALASLWVKEAGALADLQNQPALDDDACIFLIYLLCALPTGGVSGQQSVQTIASFATTSMELPNDTFIDALIYYLMMLWVDPLGRFGFNSDGIRGTLNTLNDVLINNDAATQVIKTAIGKNLKILNAIPTYPMTDPYNPTIGFTTRKSDMLEALNSAWPCK